MQHDARKKENNMESINSNKRIANIDYLRAILMVMVIIHHAFLAYTPSGYGALINDTNNVKAFEFITLYLDTFFMSLFFFISGLFTLKSIEKKGIKRFISDRFIRLMIPFTLGILIINVFGYYISFMTANNIPLTFKNFGEYIFGSLAIVPAGPLWFLWVLFVFDIIVLAIYKLKKNWIERLRNSDKKFYTHTVRFLLIFIAIAYGSYSLFESIGVSGFVEILPPFAVQISRIGLYFFFFLVGAMIGAFGIERSVVGKDSRLSTFWWLFLLISILCTFALKLVIGIIFGGGTQGWLISLLIPIVRLIFILSCVFASFGFIGLFNRIVSRKNKLCDTIANNALGIYVVHYTMVTIFQYLLLSVNISGVFKGIIVVVSSFLTSLGIVLLLKKVPFLRLSVGGVYKEKARIVLVSMNSILLMVIVIMNVIK